MHLSQAEIAGVVCLEKVLGTKTTEAHPHRKTGLGQRARRWKMSLSKFVKCPPLVPPLEHGTKREPAGSKNIIPPPQYTPIYPFGTGALQLTLHRIRPSCRDCRKGASCSLVRLPDNANGQHSSKFTIICRNSTTPRPTPSAGRSHRWPSAPAWSSYPWYILRHPHRPHAHPGRHRHDGHLRSRRARPAGIHRTRDRTARKLIAQGGEITVDGDLVTIPVVKKGTVTNESFRLPDVEYTKFDAEENEFTISLPAAHHVIRGAFFESSDAFDAFKSTFK